MITLISGILIEFLDKLQLLTGSYGWAIIMFSAIIKVLLYYPTQSQFKSMREMQKIQPEIKELQKKFKEDPQKMQTEQMKLFKKHKINPLGGCLPLIIQMPILWAIFMAIRQLAEQGKFSSETFLWIGSPLSSIYPHWFASNLADRDLPLLILYGFSMFLSQKIGMGTKGAISDSQEGTQKMMSLAMPIIFTFILWNFPAALLLYWLMFNVFSIVQQIIVMKEKVTVTPAETAEDETSPNDEIQEESIYSYEENKGKSEETISRSTSRKKKGGK